jgi:diguanylate cyclase (GGDEF)-like protein
MEGALTVVTRSAVELFDLAAGIVYEYDEKLDTVVARAMWERAPSGWNRLGEPMAVADYPMARDALVSGRALRVRIPDPGLIPETREGKNRSGDKGCLLVPMPSVDGQMGFLALFDGANERRYDERELTLANSLAELAGEAVRSERMLRRLRCLSETDSLTGVANHRKINELLAREQARGERYGTPFGVVMVDIDHFKLLNDTHGHPAGDLLLRQVAELLGRQIRASDMLGRCGGDEFLVILPETELSEATALGERLRASIASARYQTETGEQLPIRASLGISVYPDDGRGVNELLAVADVNLYESKRRGGDTVSGSAEAQSLWEGAAGFGIFESLITAVDNKDRYTRCHSEEVTAFALAMGDELGLSEASQRVLRVAGLLHDVGKIGVPDGLLRKPGGLSVSEYDVIKRHVILSETLVSALPDLDEIRAAVGSHHERYDGTGYPHGAAGKEIPLLGRILAVADAYSAMTTDRPYRKALSHAEAVTALLTAAGSQFDPEVVQAFLRSPVLAIRSLVRPGERTESTPMGSSSERQV